MMQLNSFTDGQGDHGLLGVRSQLHGLDDGPDGVESVAGHVGGRHRPAPAGLHVA